MGGVIDYCSRASAPGVKTKLIYSLEDEYEEGAKTTGATTVKNT